MSELLDKQTDKQKVRPPSMFNVVFHNDDFTTVEFVISVLITVFNKGVEEAVLVTKNVHEQGKGVAGQYTKEVAETKQIMAMDHAKAHEFPLKITLEAI